MRWITEDETPKYLTCKDCDLQFIPDTCDDLYCDECVDRRMTIAASRDARGDAAERSFCQG